MTDTLSNGKKWSLLFSGALWLALIFFALAGLLVVGHLPMWMIALVIAAGAALGFVLFLPRWLT